MKTIEFQMWLDEDGNWTEHDPASTKKVVLTTTEFTCVACDGEGHVKNKKCTRCNGDRVLYIPDYTKNDHDEVEAYFRQLEIEDYKSGLGM